MRNTGPSSSSTSSHGGGGGGGRCNTREIMDSSSRVIPGPLQGYLDLSPAALEAIVSKDPITEHYEVEQTPFARGKFAAVRRVRARACGTWYAAKVMRKRRRAQDVRHEILHEAAVLSLAQASPRIVTLHQVFETPSEMILVLELASGGELQHVIDKEEYIEEGIVRRYLRHILVALHYLHSHNIAHLDLKPQNLLLTGQYPDCDVKLCDFGISRIILSDIEVREVLGTPDYVAPEILQYEPISLSTDMWSVGVLAYVLLTGHSPFGGDSKQETFLNISQGQVDFPEDLFSGISDSAMDFISSLLIVEPSGRLTVEQAMNHPWLMCIVSPLDDKILGKKVESRDESQCCTTPNGLTIVSSHSIRRSTEKKSLTDGTNTLNSYQDELEAQIKNKIILGGNDKLHTRLDKNSEKENMKKNLKGSLKLSPLCLKRDGPKCDLTSPVEQKKLGTRLEFQDSVSLIIDKGIMC